VSSSLQADALDIYKDSIRDLYEVLDVADNGPDGFVSQTKATRFEASVLGRAKSVAQTFVRTPATIRRSGLDHVSVVLNLAKGVGDFDGRSVDYTVGDVQFRDLSRPSSSRSEKIDLVNLVVPRHVVPSWLLGRRFHGLTLPGNSPGGRLVASHLRTLADVSDEVTEAEGMAAIEATFVIAERFLGKTSEPTPLQVDAIQRTIRRRAMHLFETAATRRPPSVDDVAKAIGVSRSSLYRAFEPMGGVLRYVRHQRLSRVYAALRARAGAEMELDALAAQHGFASAKQLAKAFRDRFGVGPEEIQPSALAGRFLPIGSGVLDAAAHDVFLDWLRVGKAA
jgi:AraC-like DNA-binding protein